MTRIVVAGGSIAGLTTAATLRSLGYDGEITLVDPEREAYARPSLSKAAMRGEKVTDDSADDLGLEWLRGERAASLDADRQLVVLASGDTLKYDQLVVATGSRAARLGSPDLGEHVLRDLSDLGRIREAVAPGARVVIVGGGLLGIELASACVDLGASVTLVTRGLPARRALGDHVAQWLGTEAHRHGVEIVVTTAPVQLHGSPYSAVEVGDGRIVAADVVISTVGDLPNAEWTGLAQGAWGVVADPDGRVALNIVAVGDVRSTRAGPTIARDPHWHSAIDQGRIAAHTLLGIPPTMASPVRYIWTECFGHMVKVAGRAVDGPPTRTITSGEGHSRTIAWDLDGQTVAALAIDTRIPVPRLRAHIGAAPKHPQPSNQENHA